MSNDPRYNAENQNGGGLDVPWTDENRKTLRDAMGVTAEITRLETQDSHLADAITVTQESVLSEAAARVDADTALAAADAELAAADTALAEDITVLQESLVTKAGLDLTNAYAESVGSRLLRPGSVSLEKLDESLRSSIGSGLDYNLFQSDWNAATNTPAIPVATGNENKWYYVNGPGTPVSGNIPLVYYGLGDRIVSRNGTWVLMKAAPTVIGDGTIEETAMADNEVRPDAVLETGAKIVEAWATEDGTENILSFDENGKITPDPEASSKARLDALEPKTENLGEGLLPEDWVAGTEIWEEGCWIKPDGVNYIQLVKAELTEDGTELLHGFAADGTRYPLGSGGTSDYEPPVYSVYPQDGGGVAKATQDGETPVIEETHNWKGIQPTSENDIWIGSSNRLGAPRLFRFNILTRTVVPAKPTLLLHFGITGQSLAAGGNGGPIILTDTAIYPQHNLMFNGGLGVGMQGATISPANMASFVPMVQTVWSGRTYETAWPGFMNRLQSRISQGIGQNVRIICSNHASGGKSYADITRGSQPYANGLYEVERAKAIANAMGWEYLYAGTMLVHGEQDRLIGTTAEAYEANIKQLLAFETEDIKARTGQAHNHPIFTDGCHSWTAYNFTTPTTTIGQLNAALTSARVKMVCPKYIFEYSDGIHMYNIMYRRLGEYHAKAVFREMFGPGSWQAFAPFEIGQTSDRVWARMRTPMGHGLIFDTSLVSNPDRTVGGTLIPGRFGFELSGATITGDPYIEGDRVMIPKAGSATDLFYAYTGTSGADAGPTTGARGCLRDLDPATSDNDGTPLPNYCNTFAKAVPAAA